MQNIGIIGCGWLGLPLAKELIKEGYTVFGTTTSTSKLDTLKKEGITSFQISLSEKRIEGNITAFLEPLEVLIINVPPRLRGKVKENFVQKMTLLKEEITKTSCSKIIFASSTAVYGNSPGIVNEKTKVAPNTESGRQLVVCENLFLEDTSLQTTIIRFGGLIGSTRHPVTMLSGKKDLANGDAPVNLIHLDDCISIIKNCIEKEWYNVIMNAVYPLHPSKKEYYTLEAEKRNIEPPKYIGREGINSKEVDASYLTKVKKYSFKTSIYS